MLDSGIWPESESFSDAGLGPPPSKWKGRCQTSSRFPRCTRKIIGARTYRATASPSEAADDSGSEEPISPRDTQGHGTHTASTAAGNVVRNASLLGLAEGDARGGVPGARIAVYKVCWEEGCMDTDILAAFDDAIHDRVDIISISLGATNVYDYYQDSVAIGSFHAMAKGILTSCSAGNAGPLRGTVVNIAPWSLSVAASTIDRQFYGQLVLGNKLALKHPGINPFSPGEPWYPLIYGADAPNRDSGYTREDASRCILNSLDYDKVKGKIVVCTLPADNRPDEVVFLSGGVGVIILISEGTEVYEIPTAYMIPAVEVTAAQEKKVRAYINSTRSPLATILQSYADSHSPAPAIPSFSARGPNVRTVGILKPDITAPGHEILAAWSKHSSFSGLPEDKRFVNFNIISGTSMSCPHATGAAAYVKSFHPNWSPSAIKSALMTTAVPMDSSYPGNGDAEFAYGSGQINPAKAIHPGLVYDADADSYIDMLCSNGYDTEHLRVVTGDNSTSCPKVQGVDGVAALNYPTVMFLANVDHPISGRIVRTATNVGPPHSTYRAVVKAPSGTQITVEPSILSFTSEHQKLSFTVRIKGGVIHKSDTLLSGSLTWTSEQYNVRSPINVYCPGYFAQHEDRDKAKFR